ncbi:MAG: RHS repeat domain-containing protein [Thermonemataceae bacterium]
MNTSASKTDVSQPIGVWKTLQVSKGDTLQLSTLAKYENEATENKSTQVSPILTNSGNGSEGEGTQNPPAWVLGVAISPSSNNAEEGLPLAMLKAVLYEADGQTVIEERNTEISESAYQAWETLSSEWVMPENGFLQVSVVNASDVEVLFDNVMVEYAPTLIAQEQHFYPFGLQMAGMGKQGQPQHRYTYNGKEEVNDFNLGWIDYGARMYDPAGVRWWSLDLLAEKYFPITPYAYVGNSPMIFTDPNGMEIDWGNMTRQDKRAIKKEVRQLRKSQVFNDAWKQIKKSDKVFTIEASRDKAASGAYKAGNGEIAGIFEGNYGTVMNTTVPSDPTNPSGGTTTTESKIPAAALGGTIEINTKFLDKNENKGLVLEQALLEETFHAAQYDTYIQDASQAYFGETAGILDMEFEAKVLTGKALGQLGSFNLADISGLDQSPFKLGRAFDKSSFRTYNDYRDSSGGLNPGAAFRWALNVSAGGGYLGHTVDTPNGFKDNPPLLLNKLIKD